MLSQFTDQPCLQFTSGHLSIKPTKYGHRPYDEADLEKWTEEYIKENLEEWKVDMKADPKECGVKIFKWIYSDWR